MKSKFEEMLEEKVGNRLTETGSGAPGPGIPGFDIPDDDKIWKGVSAKLDRTRRLRIRLLSAAAVILLLISSGAAVIMAVKQKNAVKMNYSLQSVSKQLGEEENFFRLTVMRKLEEVKKSGATGYDYLVMMEQLDQIDKQYNAYMTDLQELGNQPKILKGIIRCYEMKIRVIENTLNEIAKNKHNENELHTL